MSYPLEVLKGYIESGDRECGFHLYTRLYNSESELVDDWEEEYVVWLESLLDILNIQNSKFRNCWIQDALNNDVETEYTLRYIAQNFDPDEWSESDSEVEPESEEENKSK